MKKLLIVLILLSTLFYSCTEKERKFYEGKETGYQVETGRFYVIQDTNKKERRITETEFQEARQAITTGNATQIQEAIMQIWEWEEEARRQAQIDVNNNDGIYSSTDYQSEHQVVILEGRWKLTSTYITSEGREVKYFFGKEDAGILYERGTPVGGVNGFCVEMDYGYGGNGVPTMCDREYFPGK